MLADRACADCGVRDPRVLEFDHQDHVGKVECVTLLAQRGAAWTRIEAEIAKCDIRCANCHRRRTAEQFNWPKLTFSPSVAGGPGEIRTPDVVRIKMAALARAAERYGSPVIKAAT